jgi:multidrug efflux system membrane fusion protein
VLAVPTAAVQTGQQGTYVYVVDAKTTAQTRPIAIAQQVDDLTVVLRGLTLGERIIVDGQSRLRPGGRVAVIAPGADTSQARSAAGSVDSSTAPPRRK